MSYLTNKPPVSICAVYKSIFFVCSLSNYWVTSHTWICVISKLAEVKFVILTNKWTICVDVELNNLVAVFVTVPTVSCITFIVSTYLNCNIFLKFIKFVVLVNCNRPVYFFMTTNIKIPAVFARSSLKDSLTFNRVVVRSFLF